MCKALITGGAGFIGSHLTDLLRAQGREVVIVDDLSTGRRENIARHEGNGVRFVPGRAGATLTQRPELLEGVDEVYHLAAAVGVELVVRDPAGMIRNNVEETAAVLEAAQRAGAAVLVTSSSEVYGINPKMPLGEEDELHYGPTTSARWSYGMSKALDEHLLLAWHAQKGLRGVAVRLFNTIGPRQVGRYGMVAPRFVRWALRNQPLEIHGTGRQTRSFCDVRDVVSAFPKLLRDGKQHGQVFNVGSDREISIEALADMVIALTGSQSGKRYIAYADAADRGREDPGRRVPALAKIRGAIGFAPQLRLEETLTDLIRDCSREQEEAGKVRP